MVILPIYLLDLDVQCMSYIVADFHTGVTSSTMNLTTWTLYVTSPSNLGCCHDNRHKAVAEGVCVVCASSGPVWSASVSCNFLNGIQYTNKWYPWTLKHICTSKAQHISA